MTTVGSTTASTINLSTVLNNALTAAISPASDDALTALLNSSASSGTNTATSNSSSNGSNTPTPADILTLSNLSGSLGSTILNNLLPLVSAGQAAASTGLAVASALPPVPPIAPAVSAVAAALQTTLLGTQAKAAASPAASALPAPVNTPAPATNAPSTNLPAKTSVGLLSNLGWTKSNSSPAQPSPNVATFGTTNLPVTQPAIATTNANATLFNQSERVSLQLAAVGLPFNPTANAYRTFAARENPDGAAIPPVPTVNLSA